MSKPEKQDKDKGKQLIRNSTAEFLIFTGQAGEQSIEARYEDETIWLSQKLMAQLFDVDVRTVNEHLKNIFKSCELQEDSVIRKSRITAADGKNYNTNFYNLDVIISVGYRVNSVRATQFRQWATQVLREFAIKGYVLDKKRMENGTFLGKDYFERLLEEIREIRLSERRFYQKITDIYATSVDYNRDAPTTKAFFATFLPAWALRLSWFFLLRKEELTFYEFIKFSKFVKNDIHGYNYSPNTSLNGIPFVCPSLCAFKRLLASSAQIASISLLGSSRLWISPSINKNRS